MWTITSATSHKRYRAVPPAALWLRFLFGLSGPDRSALSESHGSSRAVVENHAMNIETLREQHTNDELARMWLGADDMTGSGEQELARLERWQRSPLARWLGADSVDQIDRLRRSVDASRELAAAARAARKL